MLSVGYADQVRELNGQIKTIRSATNYQEVSQTIEKTQRFLSEILATMAGSSNFDDAIQTQFILLDILKEKTWISSSDFRTIFETTLELGKKHSPSEIREEVDEYKQFLEGKERELSSYQLSNESSK